MVFRQGTRYFLKCSIVKRNSRAFVFFMELPPPLAQPPLSNHNQHYHPPLSPPPLSQPPQLTKASFSHLLRSIFEGSLARKLHFHGFHVQFLREVLRESFIFTSSTFSSNNSFRKHLSLAMSCACLLLLEEQRTPRTTAFQRAMGRVWPIGIMCFFWLSFRYRSGYRLGHLVGSRKSAKQWFWETLLLKFLNAAWTKPEAAAENEKHKLQKE